MGNGNVRVVAVKGMYQRGKRQFPPHGSAEVNDLGEFRFANLAAGRYLLMAIVRPSRGEAKPAAGETEETYVITCFPSSAEPSGAAPVEVATGGDVGGVDIRMIASKAFQVKGKVMGGAAGEKLFVKLILV